MEARIYSVETHKIIRTYFKISIDGEILKNGAPNQGSSQDLKMVFHPRP